MKDKAWTPQEIARLISLYYAGASIRSIAREFGRSYHSVSSRLSREIATGTVVNDRQGMVWRVKQLLRSGYTAMECAAIVGCPLELAEVALAEDAQGVAA